MPKDDIKEIATGLTTPSFLQRLPETGEPLDVAGKIYRDIFAINRSMMEAVYSIDSNGNLSDQGKAAERKNVAKAKQHELKKSEAELSGLVDHTVSKARKSKEKENPLSDSAQQVRNQEIRRIISERVGNDGLEMQTMINELIETGEAGAIDAILDAPGVWPQSQLIPSYDELGAARIAMEDIKLGTSVAALIEADKELKGTIAAVENNISEFFAPPDDIKELADGDGNPA